MTRSNWEVEDGAELSLVNNTRLRMLDATGKVANRVENFSLRLAQIFLRCVALRPRTPVAEDAWPRAPSCFSEFRRLGRALQRRIEKDVKARVVRHERRIADER